MNQIMNINLQNINNKNTPILPIENILKQGENSILNMMMNIQELKIPPYPNSYQSQINSKIPLQMMLEHVFEPIIFPTHHQDVTILNNGFSATEMNLKISTPLLEEL